MSVIDDYLARLDKPQRQELERIRKLVKKIAPDADEAITYGVPGFKLKGHFFIGFSAYKNFLSLYPASTAIEIYKEKLTDYKLSKGAIRFTYDEPIPDDLLTDIIKLRYKQLQ